MEADQVYTPRKCEHSVSVRAGLNVGVNACGLLTLPICVGVNGGVYTLCPVILHALTLRI